MDFADLVHAMKRLFREPVLQFMVLAAALFALNAWFGSQRTDAPARIVVSQAQIANLQQAFARTWQREPSPEELKGLIEDHVRDEVYYREAKALDLDRDDIVIRRRLRQKMEFFAEDMDAAAPPTDADLNAYLSAHADAFQRDETISFRHVFLSSKRGDKLEGDVEEAVAALSKLPATATPRFGDAFLLGDAFDSARRSEVANDLGEAFAGKVFATREGSWQGPIASPFGLHFVFVEARRAGGVPPLDEVRGTVEREWTNARLEQRREEFYRTLRKRYDVVVELPPANSGEVTGAVR